MKNKILILITASFMLLLAACTGTATQDDALVSEPGASEEMVEENDDVMTEKDDETMDEAMMEDDDMMAEHDDEAMIDDEAMMDDESEKMEDEMMEENSEEMMEEETAVSALPAWQTIALTNAQTGEQFTFADFAGKTVFVEPMATWCTNCRRQLTDVSTASTKFGDDVIFVALSVEAGIDNDALANYAAEQGFPFIFAGVDQTLLRELVNEFGQSVSNPPATPHFIIRADGTTTELETGSESADEIVAQIQAEIQ